LRFVECVPPCRFPCSRPLPVCKHTFGPPAPCCRPCSVLVVSHHLDGFLRLQLCGLIASRYQLEVRRFSGIPARRLPKQVGWASRTPSQATFLTPFGVFPSPVAVPRHHLRLPRPRRNASQAALDVHQRPLPSCRSFTTCCRNPQTRTLVCPCCLPPNPLPPRRNAASVDPPDSSLPSTIPLPGLLPAVIRPEKPPSRLCSTVESVATRLHC